MERQRKINLMFVGVVSILLIIIYFRGCESNPREHVFEMKTYKSLSGKDIAYTNPSVVDSERALPEEVKATLEDLRIKKPEFITIIKQRTIIDTVKLYYESRLPCDSFNRSMRVDSPHYSIELHLTEEYLSIDKVEIPNEQTVVIGEKKNGIFKRNEYVIAVENSNPLVETDSIKSYVIKKPRKVSKLLGSIILFGGGIITAKLLGQ